MRFIDVRIAGVAVLAAAIVVAATAGASADPSAQPPASAEKAKADTPKPDVATLLFSDPQWEKAPAGATLDYAYSKKTSQPSFGPSFDDHIVVKLDKGDDAQSRTAEVKMFSGANAKPAGPFASEAQNPVLLLVLEENVQELSKLYKANPRYLKNAIRRAWRDDAKIVDAPVDVDGKPEPGTKITITPFQNDPQKDKMMGLEGMTYTVEIADNVPGNIAAVDIRAPEAGTPLFSETLRYKGQKP